MDVCVFLGVLSKRQGLEESKEIGGMRDGLGGRGAEAKLQLDVVGCVVGRAAALALEI